MLSPVSVCPCSFCKQASAGIRVRRFKCLSIFYIFKQVSLAFFDISLYTTKGEFVVIHFFAEEIHFAFFARKRVLLAFVLSVGEDVSIIFDSLLRCIHRQANSRGFSF